MNRELSLVDPLSLADLQVYLGRADRLDDGGVRLVAAGRILAVYVSVLSPAGILDESPTVLGLRTFALSQATELDTVVETRPVIDRIARLQVESTDAAAPVVLPLPPEIRAKSWAAISPPRSGWTAGATAPTDMLERVARAGIDEVAQAVLPGTGEQIVHRVRSEVWNRPLEGAETLPAGAAFAAFTLGFLGREPAGGLHALLQSSAPQSSAPAESATVFVAGTWTRLSTHRGHVLVRRRSLLG